MQLPVTELWRARLAAAAAAVACCLLLAAPALASDVPLPDVQATVLGTDRYVEVPGDVAAAPDGSFYVADDTDGNIRHFDADGTFLASFHASPPTITPTAGGGFYLQAPSLAVGPDGSVWVGRDIDGDQILHFSATGTYLGSFGPRGDDAQHTGGIVDLAVSNDGFVYAVDGATDHILEYQTTGALVRTIAGAAVAVDSGNVLWRVNGVALQQVDKDGTVNLDLDSRPAGHGADGATATSIVATGASVFVYSSYGLRRFASNGSQVDAIGAAAPTSAEPRLAVLAGGRFIVRGRDGGHDLLNPDGSVLLEVTSQQTGTSYPLPLRVAIGPAGSTLVADYHLGVVRVAANGTRTLFAAAGTPGELGVPAAVRVAGDGTVWVADSQRSQVVHYSAAGAFLGVVGAAGALPQSLNRPYGLAIAPDGSLWVTDADRADVKHFSAAGAFLGVAGATDDPGAGAGHLNTPYGVCAEADGSIWVADSENDRLQHFAEDGTALGTIGGPGTAPGQLSFPGDISCAGSQLLIVTDTFNNRVQWFTTDGDPVGTYGAAGATALNSLFLPFGVDFQDGRIVIADTFNRRVLLLANDQAAPALASAGATDTYFGADTDTPALDVTDTGSFVARVGALVGGVAAPLSGGHLDLNSIAEGTYDLAISALDGAGNERSSTRSIVIDRTPPYPDATQIVTVRNRTRIGIIDELSGVARPVETLTGLSLGSHTRRLRPRDRAGNVGDWSIDITYRPSLGRPWLNPRGSGYYMPRDPHPFRLRPRRLRPRLIREVKVRLEMLGYHPGPMTSGPLNEAQTAALKRFQRASGLEATGLLYPQTLNALDRAIISRS